MTTTGLETKGTITLIHDAVTLSTTITGKSVILGRRRRVRGWYSPQVAAYPANRTGRPGVPGSVRHLTARPLRRSDLPHSRRAANCGTPATRRGEGRLGTRKLHPSTTIVRMAPECSVNSGERWVSGGQPVIRGYLVARGTGWPGHWVAGKTTTGMPNSAMHQGTRDYNPTAQLVTALATTALTDYIGTNHVIAK
jgi:hypothetical protein